MNHPVRIGFGPRLLAFVVDSFIIAFLASLAMSVFMEDTLSAFMSGEYLTTLAKGQENPALMESFLRGSSFLAHFSMLYMLIEGFTGATPGKMLLRIRIGTPDGRSGDHQLYLTRYLVKNSASLLNLLGTTLGLGIFESMGAIAGMVIFFGCFLILNPQRQALHDLVAKTAVFKAADLKPPRT